MVPRLFITAAVASVALTGCGGTENDTSEEETTSVVTEDTNLDFNQPAEDGAEAAEAE